MGSFIATRRNDTPFASPRGLAAQLARPRPPLQPYIWCYGQNQGEVCGRPIVLPLPARPKHVLTFFLGDRSRGGPSEAVILGPQTHHQRVIAIAGNVDNFTIHFQPSGFHQLFGIKMDEIADASHSARAVLGRPIAALEQQLADVSSFEARVRIADRYLMGRVAFARAPDPVAKAANRVFAVNGAVRIAALAAYCDLSGRQFERRFFGQTGIAPKLYARIARFNAALDRKLAHPATAWTGIAHEFGYFDQTHMVHEFREFTGDTPVKFVDRLQSAPELHSMFATEDRAPQLRSVP
jgi:AraC-like DNA-binding protein